MSSCTDIPGVDAKYIDPVAGWGDEAAYNEQAGKLAEAEGATLCLPPLKWAADNGAMIALAAWDYVNNGWEPTLETQTRIPISQI